jgi:hypothetical protein
MAQMSNRGAQLFCSLFIVIGLVADQTIGEVPARWFSGRSTDLDATMKPSSHTSERLGYRLR